MLLIIDRTQPPEQLQTHREWPYQGGSIKEIAQSRLIWRLSIYKMTEAKLVRKISASSKFRAII